MPANNDYPSLNGISPSWADAVVKVSPDGAPLLDVSDIKAINTSSSVEVGEQRAGGRVVSRTTGSLKNEASMTLYRRGWQKLLRALKDLAPVRGDIALIRFVHFGVDYIYTPVGDDEIYERRIKGCFITGATINGAEGTDASEVEVSLNPVAIADVVDGVEYELL